MILSSSPGAASPVSPNVLRIARRRTHRGRTEWPAARCRRSRRRASCEKPQNSSWSTRARGATVARTDPCHPATIAVPALSSSPRRSCRWSRRFAPNRAHPVRLRPPPTAATDPSHWSAGAASSRRVMGSNPLTPVRRAGVRCLSSRQITLRERLRKLGPPVRGRHPSTKPHPPALSGDPFQDHSVRDHGARRHPCTVT